MIEAHHSSTATQLFALPATLLATFQTLPVLADHYPLMTNDDHEQSEQRIVYWDTADYHLLRTGFAVYLAQVAGQFYLTLENLAAGLTGKVDKPISRRPSVTAPIADRELATTLKTWPKVLRNAVTTLGGSHAKLQPILVVQRKRTVRTIAAPPTASAVAPSPSFAALKLDDLLVWAPTAGTSSHSASVAEDAVAALGQLTVAFATDETSEASALAQERITTWLANQPGLQMIAGSSHHLLEQALRAASRCAPGMPDVVGLQPQMLVADGCRLIWREQLMVMLLKEAGVRYSQDRDYVHEMRVAIRRARAAAKLYGHFLPRKTIRPYLAALRKTGRLLGYVRNLDVTIAKARHPRDGEKATQAPKKLLKAWREQRVAAHQTLVHWLDSSDYRDFLAEFQQFCSAPASQGKHDTAMPMAVPTPQQVRHVIPTQIFEEYAAIRCYEALFEAALPIADATFHQLRIACKALRYNLEFASHLLGTESEVLISRLKNLQELLGDLNDAVVAQTLVAEAKQGHAADAYQQAQAQLLVELRQRVPAALATLVDQASRDLLGKMLARL